MLQGAFVRGEDFQSSLHLRVMFCHHVEACERLVVQHNAESSAPQATAKATDAPDDTSHFQIERSPVALALQ